MNQVGHLQYALMASSPAQQLLCSQFDALCASTASDFMCGRKPEPCIPADICAASRAAVHMPLVAAPFV
jgi:hypothetical protein